MPMDTVRAVLQPAEIAEWEAEDLVLSDLAEEPETPEPEEIAAMLERLRIELPRDIQRAELAGYAAKIDTPLGSALEPDRFRYDLIAVPLNVLVPDQYRMVRLRLALDVRSVAAPPALVYDLFPPDQWSVGETKLGEANVDISKLLTFACPAPMGDCLGLKLDLPIKWKTVSARIRTSDRMSNPAEWYVRDDSIEHGFTAYAIVRSPRGARVDVLATLACELRRSGLLGRLRKARLQWDGHSYTLGKNADDNLAAARGAS